jgi:hypothetical protein
MYFLGPGKKYFWGPGSWAQNYFFSGHQYLAKSSRNYFDWEKYPGNKFQLGQSIQEINFDWEKYPGKNFQLGKTSQNPGVQKPRILGSFFWGMSPVFPGLPSQAW